MRDANPAINSKVPFRDTVYFDPSTMRSVPWPYSDIGLERDEFAYLMFGFLRV